jgi:hypothetical protein
MVNSAEIGVVDNSAQEANQAANFPLLLQIGGLFKVLAG